SQDRPVGERPGSLLHDPDADRLQMLGPHPAPLERAPDGRTQLGADLLPVRGGPVHLQVPLQRLHDVVDQVAEEAGFRSSELAALTPDSFALDAEPPTATLAAEHTKNRKPVTQPLPPEVVGALRDYLSGKPAGRCGQEPGPTAPPTC